MKETPFFLDAVDGLWVNPLGDQAGQPLFGEHEQVVEIRQIDDGHGHDLNQRIYVQGYSTERWVSASWPND